MNANGAGVTRLTTHSSWDHFPSLVGREEWPPACCLVTVVDGARAKALG
jgi:hypothetical protein